MTLRRECCINCTMMFCFNRIALDEATEETAIQDTQTPNGKKGYSLKSSAVACHSTAADYMQHFLDAWRNGNLLQHK